MKLFYTEEEEVLEVPEILLALSHLPRSLHNFHRSMYNRCVELFWRKHVFRD